jgi:hypothetical protein
MQEVDQRITLAREYLAAARGRPIDHMPPSRMMAELVETRRQLGQVLAAVAELKVWTSAVQLAEIRAVLAAFDWEFHDRQLALEEIERIATGGES